MWAVLVMIPVLYRHAVDPFISVTEIHRAGSVAQVQPVALVVQIPQCDFKLRPCDWLFCSLETRRQVETGILQIRCLQIMNPR